MKLLCLALSLLMLILAGCAASQNSEEINSRGWQERQIEAFLRLNNSIIFFRDLNCKSNALLKSKFCLLHKNRCIYLAEMSIDLNH